MITLYERCKAAVISLTVYELFHCNVITMLRYVIQFLQELFHTVPAFFPKLSEYALRHFLGILIQIDNAITVIEANSMQYNCAKRLVVRAHKVDSVRSLLFVVSGL